ncbi:hypothetical protein [Streptomyces sp. NPDC058086]|uniref:hypothetical protein n=1 Tax=Streptomyces sp. NPDC058086 TaxID=3346334 RepID=UPI0036E5C5D3
MSRPTLETTWERSERIATYVILAVLVIGEALAPAIPALDSVLNQNGAIALLAGALLLVFRMIVRSQDATSGNLRQVEFGDGVKRVVGARPRKGEILLLANDGSKYYHFISDTDFTSETARVLLFDASAARHWSRLLDRGAVGTLEIRHLAGTPLVHFVSADEKAAMFGTFMLRNAGSPSPSQTFLATNASSDGREMIDALRRMFELAWQQATPVPVAA